MNSQSPTLSSLLSSVAIGAVGQLLAAAAFLLQAPLHVQILVYVAVSIGLASLLRL